MNIVFMGTPLFSVPSLEKLIKSTEHKVLAVFTKPDKVNKRGNKIEFSEVKSVALKHGVQVYQPVSLKALEVKENLKKLNPELIVVVAYGKILPAEILNLPKYGCVNLHGSILPKYRGAAPIQRALINGEEKTGVTTMFMDEGMDTGDILLTKEINISSNDSAESLFRALSEIGADLLLETLKGISENTIKRIKQDGNMATYAPPLTKEEAHISWKNSTAKDIVNLVKGMNAGPVAYTFLGKKRIKIFKARVSNISSVNKDTAPKEPGAVISEEPLTVTCKDNTAIEILELQAENKKRMLATDFIRGKRLLSETMS